MIKNLKMYRRDIELKKRKVYGKIQKKQNKKKKVKYMERNRRNRIKNKKKS